MNSATLRAGRFMDGPSTCKMHIDRFRPGSSSVSICGTLLSICRSAFDLRHELYAFWRHSLGCICPHGNGFAAHVDTGLLGGHHQLLTSVSEKVIRTRTVFQVLGFVLSINWPWGLSSCSMTPQPVWQSTTRPLAVKSCSPSLRGRFRSLF